MADTAVTERRIRPIQDAMRAGNWRQALKECEKWQNLYSPSFARSREKRVLAWILSQSV